MPLANMSQSWHSSSGHAGSAVGDTQCVSTIHLPAVGVGQCMLAQCLRYPRLSGTRRGDPMLPQQQPDWCHPCQHNAPCQHMVPCCSSGCVVWILLCPYVLIMWAVLVHAVDVLGPCWQEADQDCSVMRRVPTSTAFAEEACMLGFDQI